jgi:YD repeat-containing protein
MRSICTVGISRSTQNALIFAGVFIALPQTALASETVTYSYDALGRLIKTVRSGGPASGVDASTQYDPAGNRTNVKVGGAQTSTPPTGRGVIVVPLDGVTLIVTARPV